MTNLHTDEIVSTSIGGSSLIGVMGTAPHSWGNYFWLSDGPRVLNFWAENLTAADKKFNLNGLVRIRRYKSDNRDVCIIDDKRIPSDWYYNKLCFTGGSGITVDIAKDIYEYLGDPDNELEQFTDPVTYYKTRGKTYNPETGIISYSVQSPSRKLDTAWTTEATQDLVDIQHASDLEDELAKVLMASFNLTVESPPIVDMELACKSKTTYNNSIIIAPYIPKFRNPTK